MAIDYEKIFIFEDYYKLNNKQMKEYCNLGVELSKQVKNSMYTKSKYKYRVPNEKILNGNELLYENYNIYSSLIVCNYIFNDNIQFINMLSSKGITYEKLSKFVTALSMLKKNKISNKIRCEDALFSLGKLIHFMTKVEDYYIIYNKIIQIVLFEKNLYNEIDKKNQNSKRK